MECKVRSVECGVRSVECSEGCKVWSEEWKV